jgi:hypothetical protein
MESKYKAGNLVLFMFVSLVFLIALSLGAMAATTTITDFSSGTCTNCTNQASGVMLANPYSSLTDFSNVISPTGLSMLFLFNANEIPTIATDYSGNGWTATATGTPIRNYSWIRTTSKYDTTFKTSPYSFVPGNNYTISLWAQLDSPLSASFYQFLVTNANRTGNQAGFYVTYRSASVGYRCGAFNTTGAGPFAQFAINDSGWHSITCVYNTTQAVGVFVSVSLYIDGIFRNSQTATYNNTAFGYSNPITIGSTPSTITESFNGSIDDIKIFNRTLSPTEILSDYNVGHHITSPGFGNYTTPIISLVNATSFYANLYNISLTCNNCDGNQNISISVRTSADNSSWSAWSNYSIINSTTVIAIFPISNISYARFSLKDMTLSLNSSPEFTSLSYGYDIFANYTKVSTSIKLSNKITQISNFFYGTNTHGKYGRQGIVVYNNSGISTEISNYTWHRDMLINGGLNYLRSDMYLESCSNGYKSYFSSCNLTTAADMVEWAHNNSIKIVYIASYMPFWLANRSDLCDQGTANTTYVSRCPPTNYSQWGDIVVNFIDQVTQNGKYNSTINIEVWNEPFGGFWLPNTTDMSIKSNLYFQLYNTTYYAIKAKYPDMPVIGPAGSFYSAANVSQGSNFTYEFLNRINQVNPPIDAISLHEYAGSTLPNIIVNSISNVRNNYSYLNNIPIIISEWNIANANTKVNDSSTFGNQVAQTYATLLQINNTQAVMYQWSESRNYSAVGYPEYPNKWSMVSEPKLDNALYISYNITKQFSSSHRAGDTVINSTSDYSNLVIVASRLNGRGAVTIVNKDTNALNVSLNLSNTGINSITSYAGTPISGSLGVFQLGLIAASEVDTYNFTYTRTLALDGCDEYLANYPINFTTLYCNNSDITFLFSSTQIIVNSSVSQALNFTPIYYPYNDISNGTVLLYNQSAYSLTLLVGKLIQVGDYSLISLSTIANYTDYSHQMPWLDYADARSYLTNNYGPISFIAISTRTDVTCEMNSSEIVLKNPAGAMEKAICTITASDGYSPNASTSFLMDIRGQTQGGNNVNAPVMPTTNTTTNTTAAQNTTDLPFSEQPSYPYPTIDLLGWQVPNLGLIIYPASEPIGWTLVGVCLIIIWMAFMVVRSLGSIARSKRGQ